MTDGEFKDLLVKWRIPLAASGAAASVAILYTFLVDINIVRIDYLVWASSLTTVAALWGDIAKHGRSHGIASTLMLDLVAAGLALSGRISSLVLAACLNGVGIIPAVGYGIAGFESLALSLIVVPASAFGLFAVTLHALRDPIDFGSRAAASMPTCHEIANSAISATRAGLDAAARHPVPVAFLIGFLVRAVPEVAWWPALVGWDTVEYAAHLDDFIAYPNPFAAHYWMGEMRNMPPLIDILLAPGALAVGSWTVYKVYPPLAYGAIVALSALLARRVLKMDGRQALLTAALSALFILNLRISWDYQRQALGTVFLMGFLAFASSREGSSGGHRSGKVVLASAALLLCAALSHEVTAFAAALLLLYLSVYWLRARYPGGAAAYTVSLAATVLLILWYYGRPANPSQYLGYVPAGIVSNLGQSSQVVSYLVAGFGVVLPLAVAGARGAGRLYLLALLGLILAGVSPLLAPLSSVTTWYRFLIGAAPLAVPLAVRGALRAGDRRGIAALSLLVIVPGCLFLSPNGAQYTSSLTGAIREFPQAMVPCPSGVRAFEGLSEAGKVAASYVGEGGAPVVAPADHARFIHTYVRNPTPSELVWLSTISGTSVNSTMNRLGVDRILLFSSASARSLNETLNRFYIDGDFWYVNIQYFQVDLVWEGEHGYSVYEIRRVNSVVGDAGLQVE